MDLSVIIVNYNVRQFLENALTSAERALEDLKGEIFVVDNASDDGSVEMVKSKFPLVHLIDNNKNVGFAKANNVAIAKSSGEFLLLLNPDTIVQEDTFKVMIDFFRENADVGLAGCKILNPDGTFQLPCRRSFPTPWVAFTKTFGLSTLFPKSRWFGKYNLTYLSPDETYQVDAVSGSFMMVRRTAFEKVGGLDETFFMYGEDLDWCYRISQSGYKVYYVHSTKIIHFKGESTKRSDIDEIRVFYQAMQHFVEKHFSTSVIVEVFLNLGIITRAAVAFIGKAGGTLLLILLDFLLFIGASILSERLYLGGWFEFPRFAYPTVWVIPGSVVALAMYLAGSYTTHRFSVVRAGMAVISSFVVISATIYFAKDFAFSRAVVIIAALLCVALLPGWRLLFTLFGSRGGGSGARKSLFGRRTLIVGVGNSGQDILRKLRSRVTDGYDVLGFIDVNRKRIGEKVAGVEIIGSLDNVGKVISEKRVGEVIFSTDGVSYTDILSVIARSNDRAVNFRLVPNSREAIIGKTRVDDLDEMPLVDIEYNLHKPLNRFAKRSFDILVATLLCILLYPFVWARKKMRGALAVGSFSEIVLLLPQVILGRLSLVGRPIPPVTEENSTGDSPTTERRHFKTYLGPAGLTGLVQINRRDDLDEEEIERYTLYYAKNQSLILDMEIILKSLRSFIKR